MDVIETVFLVEGMIIIFLFYTKYLSNAVKKRMYGDRYVPYTIVDTGEIGYITFPQDYTSKNVNGFERVYNRDRLVAGVLYYESHNAEPLKLEKDLTKYAWYCNSHEFTTVLHNKLVEKMLLSKIDDYVFMTLLIVGITMAVVAFLYMKVNGIATDVSTLKAIAEQTASQVTVVATPGKGP